MQMYPKPPPSLDQGHPGSACFLKGQEKICVFNLVHAAMERNSNAVHRLLANFCFIYKYLYSVDEEIFVLQI